MDDDVRDDFVGERLDRDAGVERDIRVRFGEQPYLPWHVAAAGDHRDQRAGRQARDLTRGDLAGVEQVGVALGADRRGPDEHRVGGGA